MEPNACFVCRKHQSQEAVPGEWPDAPKGSETQLAALAARLRARLEAYVG